MAHIARVSREPQTELRRDDAGVVVESAFARVSLRSLARIAFAMWACAAVVLALAALLTWELLAALGITTNVQSLARQLTNDSTFRLTTGAIVVWTIFAAIVVTIVATAVTVGLAALLNGISRLVGGVAHDSRRADAAPRRQA